MYKILADRMRCELDRYEPIESAWGILDEIGPFSASFLSLNGRHLTEILGAEGDQFLEEQAGLQIQMGTKSWDSYKSAFE